MSYAEGITRAKHLIAKGRYRITFSKNIEAFQEIESLETLKIDQQSYIPYFNTKTQQVVFGYLEQHQNHTLMHYVHFTQFDYLYGANSPFTWFDADNDPFQHLD